MSMRAFIVALQFLTRFPTPRIADFRPDDVSRASVYFALVGALIGLVLVVTSLVAGAVSSAVAAVGVVIAWVWVTGGLHIDGLGDVADAFGAAHRDPERFMQVLRDPHMGTFGVLAVTLQVIAKVVLVEDIVRNGSAMLGLFLVPAWARWSALVLAQWVEPLAEGSGARFKWAISIRSVAINLAALSALSIVVAPALLVAPIIAAALVLYWRFMTGGITGDCLGASIEVTETALLLALVTVAALLR